MFLPTNTMLDVEKFALICSSVRPFLSRICSALCIFNDAIQNKSLLCYRYWLCFFVFTTKVPIYVRM